MILMGVATIAGQGAIDLRENLTGLSPDQADNADGDNRDQHENQGILDKTLAKDVRAWLTVAEGSKQRGRRMTGGRSMDVHHNTPG